METEKRLILLDHALQAVSENYRSDMQKHELDMLVATRKRLKSIPTVDAVEVVRCKDCVKSVLHEIFPHSRRCKVEDCRFSHKETHFCSYGERKEDGN